MENESELGALDFDERFIQINAAICEYDSVGDAPPRKGESPFQWASIENACVLLLKEASDIRVAIWYLRACMARRGVAGLVDGIKCLAAIMVLPTEQIYPRAQSDESPGEIHALHLGWIAGPQFLHQIGNAFLEGKDVTVNELVCGMVDSAIWDQASQERAINVIGEIRESLVIIERALIPEKQVVDISRVLDLLDRALGALGPRVDAAAAPSDGTSAHKCSASTRVEDFDSRSVLSTREEVAIALGHIVEYFRVHEPGHPAPIFLSRVQRMLGAGFADLLAELYLDGAALAAKLERPSGSAE
ncbi:ImpA family type VI secretion system protein [Burkholderia seminalis]|uniref:type VI secretion system protein TssA n=1 Tax=Burkholderia seminalis TaxID=488731 RepID=UPI001581AF9C|nr:type VI secretion system ImpA family N-terminal domain-containing protein [Burkholderia seminalis]